MSESAVSQEKRDRILKKMRALLAVTVAAGATVAEAEAAVRLFKKLSDRYQIAEAECAAESVQSDVVNEEDCGVLYTPMLNDLFHIGVYLFGAKVGIYRKWVLGRLVRVARYHGYGFDAKLAAATVDQVYARLRTAQKVECKGWPVKNRNDWLIGAIDGFLSVVRRRDDVGEDGGDVGEDGGVSAKAGLILASKLERLNERIVLRPMRRAENEFRREVGPCAEIGYKYGQKMQVEGVLG